MAKSRASRGGSGQGQELKKLLITLGIATAEWSDAVKTIRQELERIDVDERKKYEEKKRMAREQLLSLQESIKVEKKTQEEVRTQLVNKRLLVENEKVLQAQARTRASQEQATAAAIKAQTASMQQQAVVARQAAQQQAQAARAAQQAGGGGGQGASGGFGLAQGMFGALGMGKFASSIATGSFFGTLGADLILKLGDAISDLTRKVVNFIEASGPLSQIVEQFERLASKQGSSPSKFAEDLEKATRGLVDTMSLLRTANTFLQANLGISNEQMLRLTRATVDLARAQGRDAQFAIEALNRSFLTGRFQSLAYALGIERSLFAVKGLSDATPQLVRRQLEFDQTLNVVEKRLKTVGEPTLTLTEQLRQVAIQVENLFENIALETYQTANFKDFQKTLAEFIRTLMADGPRIAKFIAQDLKYAFDLLNTALTPLIVLVKGADQALALLHATAEKLPAKVAELPAGILETIRRVNLEQGMFERLGRIKDAIDADEQDPEYQLRLARERLETEKSGWQKSAAFQKAAIDQQKMELDASYRDREISLETFVTNSILLREKELKQSLLLIEQEKKAKLDALAREKMSAEIRALSQQRIDNETAARRIQAFGQYQSAVRQLNSQLKADVIQSERGELEGFIQLQQGIVANRQQVNERLLRQGVISEEEYSTQRKQIFQQEYEFAIRLAELRFKYSQQTSAAETALLNEKAKAEQDYKQKLVEEDERTKEARFQRDRTAFENQRAVLQAQRSTAAPTGLLKVLFPLGTATESELRQKEIDLLEGEVSALMKRRDALDKNAEMYGKLTREILEHLSAIQQLKAEAVTLASVLATGLGQLGGALSLAGLKEVGSGLAQGGGILGSLVAYRQAALGGKIFTGVQPGVQLTQRGLPWTLPSQQIETNPLRGLFNNFKELFKGKDFTKNLQGLFAGMAAMAPSIGGFVTGLTGSQGPVQGGLTGMMGGAGAGAAIGALWGAKGGPIGAAIGAAVGLVTGIIAGTKRKATSKIAADVSQQFNKIMESLNLGTTKLKDAILQAEKARSDAIARLSGKKGGSDELKQILPQMDQTINQLKSRQQEIFRTFDETLKIMRAPDVFEEHLRSVDAIIDKYQEYIDAGGNVAQANEFLLLSYEALRNRGLENLAQAELDAVENALEYNRLLVDRQKVIDQTNQQIEDILYQGVPTRTRTTAQTRFEQIAELEKQRDERLKEMDQQIKLAQHRMEAERTIFALANDRIGLETRLLELKFAEQDRDMERIRALVSLINMLGNNPGSLSSLNAVLQTLGFTQAPTAPGSGSGPRGRLGDLLDDIYGERGRQGLGNFFAELP